MPTRNKRKVSTKGLSDKFRAYLSSVELSILQYYFQSSLQRYIPWELSGDQFKSLIHSNCTYCGKPPYILTKLRNRNNILYTGIDRVDNSKGYTPGNTVPCCKYCNSMKSDMPTNAFLAHVVDITRFQSDKSQMSDSILADTSSR